MLESFNTDKFEYKKLSQEEQERRGILGRLVGKIADTKNPTRNGRKYSIDLWEKVFNDPIMQEKIDNHLLLGELSHPEDREEIDPTQAAICMAERPKKGKDGFLYGVFDILDTPNGRILKTLCDYGCNIGISSRGTGDIIYDEDGNEAVDPDTYVCETWDAVLVPGVQQARLQYVTEALDIKKRNKTLRQKLSEELDKASDEDKKIMNETLDNLNIKLDEDASEGEYVASVGKFKIYKDGDMYVSDLTLENGNKVRSTNFDALVNLLKGESENLDEKLVEVPQTDLNEIKSQLNDLGFDIEKEGETLFGSIHFQIRLRGDDYNAEDLRAYADKLYDFTEYWEEKKIPITFNIGLTDTFEITCGLDIHEKYIEDADQVEEALHGEDCKTFAKAFLDINDEDDLLNHIKEIASYDKILGRYLMKINMGGGSVAYRAKKMSDFLTEELQNTDGWGERIPDQLEQTFRNIEDMMYEVRNARRGSYAINGDTVQDLVGELRDLSDQLAMNADDLEFDQDSLNEDAKLNIKDETIKEDCSDKEDDIKDDADNAGEDLTDQLQEALLKSAKLEKDNLSLQEQLSVCNAKELKLNEELRKCKKAIANLSESSKNINKLKEELDNVNDLVKKKDKLLESTKNSFDDYKVKMRKSKLNNLKESLSVEKTEQLEQTVKKLTEQLNEKDKELSEIRKVAKKFKSAYNESKDMYVTSQAKAFGVDVSDVKRMLKESYSLKDVDSVCESLYEQKTNLSKLPFRLNEGTKLGFTPSKNERLGNLLADDDVVSERLLRMLD